MDLSLVDCLTYLSKCTEEEKGKIETGRKQLIALESGECVSVCFFSVQNSANMMPGSVLEWMCQMDGGDTFCRAPWCDLLFCCQAAEDITNHSSPGE